MNPSKHVDIHDDGYIELSGASKKIAMFLVTPSILAAIICLIPGCLLACIVTLIDVLIKRGKHVS